MLCISCYIVFMSMEIYYLNRCVHLWWSSVLYWLTIMPHIHFSDDLYHLYLFCSNFTYLFLIRPIYKIFITVDRLQKSLILKILSQFVMEQVLCILSCVEWISLWIINIWLLHWQKLWENVTLFSKRSNICPFWQKYTHFENKIRIFLQILLWFLSV